PRQPGHDTEIPGDDPGLARARYRYTDGQDARWLPVDSVHFCAYRAPPRADQGSEGRRELPKAVAGGNGGFCGRLRPAFHAAAVREPSHASASLSAGFELRFSSFEPRRVVGA